MSNKTHRMSEGRIGVYVRVARFIYPPCAICMGTLLQHISQMNKWKYKWHPVWCVGLSLRSVIKCVTYESCAFSWVRQINVVILHNGGWVTEIHCLFQMPHHVTALSQVYDGPKSWMCLSLKHSLSFFFCLSTLRPLSCLLYKHVYFVYIYISKLHSIYLLHKVH